MSHSHPSGRLRHDLVAEADTLRRQFGTPSLAAGLMD